MIIGDLTHPNYNELLSDWTKWRITYEGGDYFVNTYLRKYSDSESETEFEARKTVTYRPNHAKRAVDKVKNAIFQRLVDVKRVGGDQTYQNAMSGLSGGVDMRGSTMNSFIGNKILPELLPMGRVAVFIDMPRIKADSSAADAAGKRPYLYYYPVEDIITWVPGDPDSQYDFKAVVLKDRIFTYDDATGLPNGETNRYRHLKLTNNQVVCDIYDDKSNLMETVPMGIKRIPVVFFELTSALMKDIADHQIALLNLASSDMSYLLSSNIPSYIEQYDPKVEAVHALQAQAPGDGTGAGTADAAKKSKSRKVVLGHKFGRAYPVGTNAPEYIAPPTDPTKVSMEKQEKIIEDIDKLLDLTMSSMSLTGEAKKQDKTGLEAGLSYIGLVLQLGETKVASYWNEYLGNKVEDATISYPTDYSLKTDLDRLEEAKKLKELKSAAPSKTYAKWISKKIAHTQLEGRVPKEDLDKIDSEIDSADYLTSDIKDLQIAHQEGFVTADTCSQAMGFAPGEAKKAEVEHAERLARIAISQSEGMGAAAGARGVKDGQLNAADSKNEKLLSRNNTQRDTTDDGTRGAGRDNNNG